MPENVRGATPPGSVLSHQVVAVETNEGGQLTERLARHAQQAPVLDAWLAKFLSLRILASKAAVAAIKVGHKMLSCVM